MNRHFFDVKEGTFVLHLEKTEIIDFVTEELPSDWIVITSVIDIEDSSSPCPLAREGDGIHPLIAKSGEFFDKVLP